MKYLSVCSGIEAATVAWHGLGWEPVAFAEVEPFPAAALAHHYPTVPNLGDLTKYREWPEELLAEVELLAGGTPCQAFSVAGQRRSLDDERGNLSLVYVNLYHHINEVRKRHGRSPAIALWENVPGCLSTKDNAFGCILGGLLGCDEAPATESGKWDKAGFLSSETVRVGYRVLDAQYFGVAQRRRRVFLVAVPCELVASLGERVCPSEILSLRESVLGNPPARGAAWEGASRATASGLTSSGRGVERPGESRGQDDVVIEMRERERERASCGRPHGDGQNAQGLRLDDGFADADRDEPTCFHPTQDPIFSRGGAAHAVSTGSRGGCASHAVAFNAYQRTVSEVASPVMSQDHKKVEIGVAQPATVAFKPGQSEAAGGTFVTEEFAPTVQSQNNGSTAVPAVAFKPSHFTRGKDGKPAEVTPPLSADADKGDQDTIVAAPFTKSKRAQSNQDDESWVPGEVAPTQNQFDQGDTRATTVVAFSPLQGGRSMPVTPESPTLEAGTGNKTPAVALSNGPVQVQWASGGGQVENPTMQSLRSNAEYNCQFIRNAMQVRRLTPRECAYLQGFPPDYLDITFRKKPAADGPKYRALGNSMAVPCMWWLGYRIQQATALPT